eukprot:jgi/Tetstr1/438668/TSEL_027218.t1
MDTLARDPDHYRKVVDIFVFNDPTYRDKVLKNPRSYKVHTSHFADSDKRDIKRKGASEMDSLVVSHMRSRIKLLEEQLADNKNLYSTAKIEAERLREKLGQAAREKEVLMEQLEHVQAQLGAAQHTCGNVIANLAKELERKNAEIDGMLDGLVDRLTWENVMKEGSAWNACINHIVGFPTAQSLQKFFEWVNCEGVADRLRYWNGKQSMQRMEAEANGTAQRESVGKPEQRTFTTQNALLVTLVKLRTGLGTRVISAWSGIKVSCLTRIFPTWISYLDQFFKAEFPVPITANMLDRVHPEWREAYGALVRFVLDCTELSSASIGAVDAEQEAAEADF